MLLLLLLDFLGVTLLNDGGGKSKFFFAKNIYIHLLYPLVFFRVFLLILKFSLPGMVESPLRAIFWMMLGWLEIPLAYMFG